MLSEEKQWSIIQTKTKTTKVNAVSCFFPAPLCKSDICISCKSVLNGCLFFFFFAEVAEAKFKEVMDSYEAIKLERRNGSC